MSAEIYDVIAEKPIAFSPVVSIGEFVVRHFHHPIFGFGTLETASYPIISKQGVEIESEIKIKGDKLGPLGCAESFSFSLEDEDTIETLNKCLIDSETASEIVNESAEFIVDDPFDRAVQGVKLFHNGEEISIDALLDPDYRPDIEE